jgi:hypothetical protein
MENFYPIFALFIAVAALAVGWGELVFLNLKPAAILTWLSGWVTATSLIFSSTWDKGVSASAALILTALYFWVVFKVTSFDRKP